MATYDELLRRDREQGWRSGGADVEMVAGIRALPPDEHGHHQFILLDDRVAPARPVGGYEAFGPGGPTGPNWDGRYDALADHYPWLAGITRSAGHRTDGGEVRWAKQVPLRTLT